jgi:two-component system response regulator BaeR
MQQQTIVIVEDEQKLANVLRDYLHQSYFITQIFNDGVDVVKWVKDNPANAVLLDLMLPGKDGIQICREIREFSQIPILMVTARVEEIDRLLGLEIGADDYICKPFSPREVVARVKAVLRRTAMSMESGELIDSGIVLDSKRLQVQIKGQVIVLTAIEFAILKQLSKDHGRIFSRQQLMDNIYSDNRIVSDRTIDSHIKKLRKKLLDEGNADLIRSVYGVGYKFEWS